MSRSDKVAEEIRKEVSMIVAEELRDPRLGFTTITRCALTPDLRFARVFFSVYGDEQKWKDTQAGLEHAIGFIRRALGERLDLRFVPEIVFASDHSSEYSIIIEQRLEEIKSQQAITNKPKPKKRKAGHAAKKTLRRLKKKTK
ncbi:MAG: ribosome-binding factor A [Candidatus Omnitrophica bacterium CG1_02_44_16]|nr:MAG: ribosome-binding factor A [Candidatus Omnitrophica bacterium CG1_02_44_16]PIY83648.1 MAG: ribosome-binding factor A [Candidatus Omnitrophica bacterium CG_4_10_14_0_8_um_filter_44_12]PIZ84068.1 MAG: ribosome-binding factor A [Candidatus Omnitrophica bacterium CG_4_10_14_0_2_um_filter_44_9]